MHSTLLFNCILNRRQELCCSYTYVLLHIICTASYTNTTLLFFLNLACVFCDHVETCWKGNLMVEHLGSELCRFQLFLFFLGAHQGFLTALFLIKEPQPDHLRLCKFISVHILYIGSPRSGNGRQRRKLESTWCMWIIAEWFSVTKRVSSLWSRHSGRSSESKTRSRTNMEDRRKEGRQFHSPCC